MEYYDTAFPVEFKKHSRNTAITSVSLVSSILFIPPLTLSHDLSEVTRAMQHIMAADAHQSFVFGMTIESTSLILWYDNRSKLVCSKPLDITKVVNTSLLVFQVTFTSIGKEMLEPGLPVVCVRTR